MRFHLFARYSKEQNAGNAEAVDGLAFIFQVGQGKLRDARHTWDVGSGGDFFRNEEGIDQLMHVQTRFLDQLSHFVRRAEAARPMSEMKHAAF